MDMANTMKNAHLEMFFIFQVVIFQIVNIHVWLPSRSFAKCNNDFIVSNSQDASKLSMTLGSSEMWPSQMKKVIQVIQCLDALVA